MNWNGPVESGTQQLNAVKAHLVFTPAIEEICFFIKKWLLQGKDCLWVDVLAILGVQQELCESFKIK